MVQWLRICLAMQGTWVQSLVWKIPWATVKGSFDELPVGLYSDMWVLWKLTLWIPW